MAGLSRVASGLIPERLEAPLRSASFRRLALGKSISYLGDWLMVAVLVGWVYESTSSVAQVALLMAIRLVPPIVGGGLAASFVDRLRRWRVGRARGEPRELRDRSCALRPHPRRRRGLCYVRSRSRRVGRRSPLCAGATGVGRRGRRLRGLDACHGSRQRDLAEVHDWA